MEVMILESYSVTIASRKTININFTIYGCGYEKCRTNTEWETRLLDYHVLFYILDGKGMLSSKGKEYHLKKGQGFLISPNTMTAYKADPDDPWTYVYVSFEGFLVENYLYRARLSSVSPTFTYDYDDYLEKRFNEMIRYSKVKHNRYCKMIAELYLIISRLIDHNQLEYFTYAKLHGKEYYIQKALGYVELNYSRDMTVEDIANYLGITRKYFYHIFREATNKSPKDYIIEYRITTACHIIEYQECSISEVAYLVGYNSPFHFSETFKKLKGMSPTEYKKRLKDSWSDEEKYKRKVKELLSIIHEKEKEIKMLKEELGQY